MSIAEDNRTTNPIEQRDVLSPRLALCLVLIACVPFYFWALGHPPLFDPDEPVYAATGRAMLRSHTFAGWWSPHYNGRLWFDKPPLTYWLIALSMRVFGEGAFAARLPSSLCALSLVAATGGLTNSLVPKSRWSGVWAAIVIATCLQSAILARAAVTDMILALCLTLALWGLWRWLEDARQVRALLEAGVATGLAVLTKGPVAIVLIGGVSIFYLLATRQAVRLLAPMLWGALVLALAIALPWYLSMTRLHGALFIQGFLEANNLTRYVSAEHSSTSSPLFFVPVLIGFLFPWTGAFVAAMPRALNAVRGYKHAAMFVMIWVVLVFGFFSFSQTKLVTYIYPLYPMLAVLIGHWIATGPPRWAILVHVVVYGILMGGVAILLPSLVRHSLPVAVHAAAIISVLLGATVVGTVAALAVWLRSTSGIARAAVFGLPACAMVLLFVPVASAGFWDQPVPKVSQTELAGAIKAQTHPGDIVRAMTLDRPSLVYYSERNIVFTDSRNETATAISHVPYPLCATRVQYVSDLASHLPVGGHLKTVSQSGQEFVLLRYQPPDVTTAR